jgi:hypothetical protein
MRVVHFSKRSIDFGRNETAGTSGVWGAGEMSPLVVLDEKQTATEQEIDYWWSRGSVSFQLLVRTTRPFSSSIRVYT